MVYTNRRTLKRTLLGSTSIDWHYAQTKVSSVSVHAKLRSKVYCITVFTHPSWMLGTLPILLLPAFSICFGDVGRRYWGGGESET